MNTVLNVWYGTNEHASLSNLAKREFQDNDGRLYVSVEHAYQSWKSGSFDQVTYSKPWRDGSKFVGRRARTVDNWNIKLMGRLILRSLSQNAWFRETLQDLPHDVEFSHTQDRGIWKEEFPRLLRIAKAGADALSITAIKEDL